MTRLEEFRDDMCRWCGGEIDRSRPHSGKRVYCSLRCGIQHATQLFKDGRIADKAGRDWRCQFCGEPMSLFKKADTLFCRIDCQRRFTRAAVSTARLNFRVAMRLPCQGCGGSIPPERKLTARYCANQCRKSASQRRRRAALRCEAVS